jgi:RNA polymerase sigma-70 factor, ECF subfamily
MYLDGAMVADGLWPARTQTGRAHIEATKPAARSAALEGEAEAETVLKGLMARYQAGDLEAFDDLYRRTHALVHRYHLAYAADRSQASDLAQDTYLQLHRSRRLYDPQLRVTPWLLAIARHVRLMAHRTRRRRLAKELRLDESLEPAVDFNALVDHAILAQALERIPDRHRDPLVFHHLLGLSFREIGGIVGASEGGARIRAARGMAALREVLRSARTDTRP